MFLFKVLLFCSHSIPRLHRLSHCLQLRADYGITGLERPPALMWPGARLVLAATISALLCTELSVIKVGHSKTTESQSGLIFDALVLRSC